VIVGRTPGPAAEIVVEPASKAPARQDRLHTQHERGREER
jgi:hypothetical protein